MRSSQFGRDGRGVYKVEISRGLPADEPITIYRGRRLMDLCRGPHVPSTRYLKAFKLTSRRGRYWRGDEHNAMLSRILRHRVRHQRSAQSISSLI